MAQSESTKRIMKKNLAELKKMRTANDKEMLKHLNDSQKKFNKLKEKLKQTKPMTRSIKKTAKKSLAKRLVGRGLSKAIPGVGAVMIASEVVKAISKKTCISKGGKIVNGKCKGGKKDNRKITSPKARDLKSKR